MKRFLAIMALAALASGCASINSRTHAYLGVPGFAPTQPEKVQILSAEPKTRQHERLGEIFLDIGGSPSKAAMEKRLRKEAAKLGADAVFVLKDEMHVFPVVYVDWWGPLYSQDARRAIIAVAIKFK